MKISSEYPLWELHPRKLSSEEVADPQMVIASFFDYASLPQVRDKMWLWLEATVSGTYSKELSSRERSNIMLFYQHVERLIEAAHVMHAAQKSKQRKIQKAKKR
jgi:hypothetical protein